MQNNHQFDQYCESNIGLFSVAPCTVIALAFFALFLVSVLCLFTLLLTIFFWFSKNHDTDSCRSFLDLRDESENF